MLFENKHIAILFKYVGEKKHDAKKIMYEEIYLITVGLTEGEIWSEYSRILNNI